MTEQSELERRVADWMEHRPERMPDAVFATMIEAVGGTRPRSRWTLRLWGESLPAVPLMAALVGMLLVGALLAGAVINRPDAVVPTLSVAFVSQPGSAPFEALDGQIEAGLSQQVGTSIVRADRIVPGSAASAALDEAAATHDVVVVSLLEASGLRADAVSEAARRNPDVTFVVFGEVELGGANVAVVHWRKAEGGYLAGILAAGLAPDAATAGFLGGDATSRDVDAFEAGYRAGLESVAASMGVATERVGFNDGTGARSAMTRLLEAGSRVVFAAAGVSSRDAIALAAERKAFVIGADEDASHLAPQAVIASVRVRADVVVGRLLAARARGEMISGIYEFGAGDGSIDLYLNPALAPQVPPAVVARVAAATEAFRSGTLSLESPR